MKRFNKRFISKFALFMVCIVLSSIVNINISDGLSAYNKHFVQLINATSHTQNGTLQTSIMKLKEVA